MTVMLSGPPRWLARATNSLAISLGQAAGSQTSPEQG
jgi:hypothetical protein